MKKFSKVKYCFIGLISCLAIAATFFAVKTIANFKDVDSRINKIEGLSNLRTYKISNATGSNLPIEFGGLQKDKSAYFSVAFTFKGGDAKAHQNIFQTAPYNSGIRVELSGGMLAVIYSDYQKSNGYSALVLEKNLNLNESHRIRIEALTKEFLRISLDGKTEIIKSPYLIFATNQFLVGGGYSPERNYTGSISDIQFKFVNYHSWIGSALRHMPRDFGSLLTSFTKVGLLFPLFLYLIFRRLKFEAVHFPKIRINTYWEIAILILIQILLVVFFPPYRVILIQYVYLCLVGIFLVSIMIPSSINANGYLWLFAPLMGLMLNAITGAYVIAYSLPVRFIPILPLLPACIALGRRLFLRGHIKKPSFPPVGTILGGLRLLTFLAPIFLLFLWPGFDGQNITTPIRIGPDAALYGFMNQYLLDGGSWAEALMRLSEFEGMRVGDITRYTNLTMDWPFLYYYRWGLTSYQLTIGLINGVDHAYKFGFISLIIPYLFLGGLIFYWLKEVLKLNFLLAILGSVGFIFNVNLLNLWFEGFYGNTFSLCLYGFLYLLIDSLSFKNGLAQKEKIRNAIFFGFLFSAILVSYGEGLLFVLPLLLAIHGILNLILRRSIDISLYLQMLTGLVIAILALIPCHFLLDWLLISIKQVTEEGGNGYPQPYWAFLSEILGLSNIYQEINTTNGGVAMIYSTKQFILTVSSTAVLLAIVVMGFFRKKTWCTLGCSAYFLTALFLYYVYKNSPLNNYAYMKMYAFMLPILFVYFWGSFASFLECSEALVSKGLGHIIAFSLALTMVINGAAYIAIYESTSKKVQSKQMDDHHGLSALKLENAVIYPALNSIYPYLLPALYHATWLTVGWENSAIDGNNYLSKFLDRKIFLLTEKDECLEYKFNPGNLIYDGAAFLVVDSGISIRDAVKAGRVDLSGIDARNIIQTSNSKQCLSMKIGAP